MISSFRRMSSAALLPAVPITRPPASSESLPRMRYACAPVYADPTMADQSATCAIAPDTIVEQRRKAKVVRLDIGASEGAWTRSLNLAKQGEKYNLLVVPVFRILAHMRFAGDNAVKSKEESW